MKAHWSQSTREYGLSVITTSFGKVLPRIILRSVGTGYVAVLGRDFREVWNRHRDHGDGAAVG